MKWNHKKRPVYAKTKMTKTADGFGSMLCHRYIPINVFICIVWMGFYIYQREKFLHLFQDFFFHLLFRIFISLLCFTALAKLVLGWSLQFLFPGQFLHIVLFLSPTTRIKVKYFKLCWTYKRWNMHLLWILLFFWYFS